MRPGAIRPGIMEGMNEVDVLIVGGGLVGTSLAIALSRSSAGGSNARGSNALGAKLRVALVEGTALHVDTGMAVPPSHDERNLAPGARERQCADRDRRLAACGGACDEDSRRARKPQG